VSRANSICDQWQAGAGPLADAKLTPYRAIKRALTFLHSGSMAVVIGVGGLGRLALELPRVVAP